MVAAVERYSSGRGHYLVAALAGLPDVDAITLSMAGLARGGGIDLATVVGALVVATLREHAPQVRDGGGHRERPAAAVDRDA